jgi:DNA adenine methylase
MNHSSDINGIKPFLTYPGGKYKYAKVLPIPEKFGTYIEPFVGSGGMLFALCPSKFIINDLNCDLINLYKQIKRNYKALIEVTSQIQQDKATFLDVGKLMNDHKSTLNDLDKAACYLYLTKLSFNAHLNFKQNGQYVLAYSRFWNKTVVDKENLRKCSKLLQRGRIECKDYMAILKEAKKGDFVFLDPPYITDTQKIYNDNWNIGSNEENMSHHTRLYNELLKLHKKGVYFTLTYNFHPDLYDIYKKSPFKLMFTEKNHTIVHYIRNTTYKEIVVCNF